MNNDKNESRSFSPDLLSALSSAAAPPKGEFPVGIGLFDDRGNVLYQSPSYVEILEGLVIREPGGAPRPLSGILRTFVSSTGTEGERHARYTALDSRENAHILDCSVFPMPPQADGRRHWLLHIQDRTTVDSLARETLVVGRYQEVLGKIAHLAVTGAPIQEVADLAARETARALDVEFCKILIPGDSDPLLHLLAGVGWREGLVGTHVQEGGSHSQAGFAIRQRKPVVVFDLDTEKRFSPSKLLAEHGVRSGVSVPMMFQDQALGAMSVHTRSLRRFDEREIGFLETVANTFATILERWKREEVQLSLYNRLFAQLQDGVFLTDTRGIILEWNPAMERMSGWSRPEALGRTPALIASGRHSPDFYALLWESLRAGKPFTGRFVNHKKDRTEFLVWESISPVMDPDGTIRYFLAILTDLSEREKLLEALRHMEQIKLVGQLSGGLLHEIRNPLIGIGSLADHLTHDQKLPDPLKRQAQLIASEARRIDELLESHLSVLRPKTFDFQPLDLEDLLMEARSLLQQTLLKARIQFSLEAEKGLPAVEGARGPLHQVFLNLMMNGIEAMSEGGKLSVRLSAMPFQDRNGIAVSIEDSGKGIPDALMKKLHDPFFTHGKARGIGLGLTITRDIVDRHGGHLTIDNIKTGGVRAVVWIPVKQEGQAN